MTNDLDPIVRDDHIEGEAEHVFWLADAEQWRADHRRLIKLLMEAQSAILEQDAALDVHCRSIHEHEGARLRHEALAAAGVTDVSTEAALKEMHRQLEIKHARGRAAHERMAVHHKRLVELVEGLVSATEQAM